MKIQHPNNVKSINTILSLIALGLAAPTLQAATLAQWDFQNITAPSGALTSADASFVDSNVTITDNDLELDLTLAGTDSLVVLGTSSATNGGGAISLGSNQLQISPAQIGVISAGLDPGIDFLEFEVTPGTGLQIENASITYDQRIVTGSSSTGGLVAFSGVFYSTDGGSNWTQSSTGSQRIATNPGLQDKTESASQDLPTIVGTTLVRITFIDNSNIAPAGDSGKAFYIDNYTLNGELIPESSAVSGLLGLTALAIVIARRRKQA
ncbi:hypothetical protein [Rubellicoccus peritrichatus]|uniref:PEP-CTERM protein-sorting domain-containing protein n=1 Tax=Rubellicoccus peritrichatus TaxID=3080537 RepID=A0AAQ3LBS4_9BACT|nr:hypothetical protein [Puniceicoccus sp. CR14]WOO43184.1 hypothetical protein RZN69_08765 [Puniceicoccus sp. CR14]